MNIHATTFTRLKSNGGLKDKTGVVSSRGSVGPRIDQLPLLFCLLFSMKRVRSGPDSHWSQIAPHGKSLDFKIFQGLFGGVGDVEHDATKQMVFVVSRIHFVHFGKCVIGFGIN